MLGQVFVMFMVALFWAVFNYVLCTASIYSSVRRFRDI